MPTLRYIGPQPPEKNERLQKKENVIIASSAKSQNTTNKSMSGATVGGLKVKDPALVTLITNESSSLQVAQAQLSNRTIQAAAARVPNQMLHSATAGTNRPAITTVVKNGPHLSMHPSLVPFRMPNQTMPAIAYGIQGPAFATLLMNQYYSLHLTQSQHVNHMNALRRNSVVNGVLQNGKSSRDSINKFNVLGLSNDRTGSVEKRSRSKDKSLEDRLMMKENRDAGRGNGIVAKVGTESEPKVLGQSNKANGVDYGTKGVSVDKAFALARSPTKSTFAKAFTLAQSPMKSPFAKAFALARSPTKSPFTKASKQVDHQKASLIKASPKQPPRKKLDILSLANAIADDFSGYFKDADSIALPLSESTNTTAYSQVQSTSLSVSKPSSSTANAQVENDQKPKVPNTTDEIPISAVVTKPAALTESKPLQSKSISQVRKNKKPKDPNAPKRSRTAYMFYVAEHASQIKAEFPNIPFGEMSKVMGQRWKGLTPDQKKKYDDLAMDDKARYHADLNLYHIKLSEDHIKLKARESSLELPV